MLFQLIIPNFSFCSEIKCIIDAFGSHLNVDLQQRSVEFSQLFKTHSNLRSALLEKMPPMQVVRVSNQINELLEENENNLIENGIESLDNPIGKVPNSDSVRFDDFFFFKCSDEMPIQ